MDISKHKMLFSDARIARYVRACNNDGDNAIKFYKFNIQASQALYPIISTFEIALRNTVDRQLRMHYGDENWLITKRDNFANNHRLIYKNAHGVTKRDFFFADKLAKAEYKLKVRNKTISHSKLMTELTFGFWVKFFDKQAIKILNGAPLKGFNNKPTKNLTRLNSHLHAIVTLLNRISHSEPICFDRHGEICLPQLQEYESNLFEAMNWIDQDLADWSRRLNFFKPIVKRITALQNQSVI